MPRRAAPRIAMSSVVVFFFAVALTFGSVVVAFGPRLRRSVTGAGSDAISAAGIRADSAAAVRDNSDRHSAAAETARHRAGESSAAARPHVDTPQSDDGATTGSTTKIKTSGSTPAERAETGTSMPGPSGEPRERGEILSQLHAFALGSAVGATPASARHAAVADTIAARIKTVSTNPRYAPRRPRLLPKLLRAVNDDETTRRELAAIISRDPALVGNLLKLANSAFYRVSEQPVESVERAVAVLGTEGIRSLVAAAVMQPVLRKTAGQSNDFVETVWEQTYRAAAGAEAHAAFIEKTDRFAGQLLGLLSGLGTIVVYRLALDRFAARGLSPDAAVIRAAIETHAGDAALRIAASWGVSDRILHALDDARSQRTDAQITPLARSLRFGSVIGALAVLRANGLVDDEAAAAAVRAMGASEEHAERIWMRLRT